MCKIIAIANQKGGVAKTTTTINLGVGLSKVGKRVMLIDADPQGHLTMGLGFPKNLQKSEKPTLIILIIIILILVILTEVILILSIFQILPNSSQWI